MSSSVAPFDTIAELQNLIVDTKMTDADTAPNGQTEEQAPEQTETKNTFSLNDLSKHDSCESCWVAIHGKVYDVTAFLEEHPGGDDVVLENSGALIPLPLCTQCADRTRCN